jgi:hypothetical protein
VSSDVGGKGMKTKLAVASFVFVLAGIYCALWIISSASLACTACNCEYSLFASSLRCRQPYIAMILSGLFFALAALALFSRWRLVRRKQMSTEEPNG